MRPLVPPSLHRTGAVTSGRARNLERRYIPTDQSTQFNLDWVWTISFAADVAGNDGKIASGPAIEAFSSSGDFYSIVTETVNDGTHAPYAATVLSCPAGYYLAAANLSVFGEFPSPAAVSGPWLYKIIAKDPVSEWDHETNPVWQVDQWRTPGLTGNTPDPNVISETLVGLAPFHVPDLGDGFGRVSLWVVNEDAATHHFGDGFLFLLSLSLSTPPVTGAGSGGGTATIPPTAVSTPSPTNPLGL